MTVITAHDCTGIRTPESSDGGAHHYGTKATAKPELQWSLPHWPVPQFRYKWTPNVDWCPVPAPPAWRTSASLTTRTSREALTWFNPTNTESRMYQCSTARHMTLNCHKTSSLPSSIMSKVVLMKKSIRLTSTGYSRNMKKPSRSNRWPKQSVSWLKRSSAVKFQQNTNSNTYRSYWSFMKLSVKIYST